MQRRALLLGLSALGVACGPRPLAAPPTAPAVVSASDLIPADLDITAEMKTACETVLAPIIETILDLLSRVEPEFQEKVRNNIIISGGGGLIKGLPEALEEALVAVGGGKVRFMEDPVFIGSDGGLALAADAPEGDWEKLSA